MNCSLLIMDLICHPLATSAFEVTNSISVQT